MSRRLSRILLALVCLLSSEAWALGLGEVRLNSALNEPLRAEIELLSATPEELTNLKIDMASAETFDRYGIDRPVFLQGIQFRIVSSGRADGNYVEVRSGAAITEPFLTFLVEANWARGRLLREYTVLLDPPTFAPQAMSQPAPAVTAPTRSAPADSGRIERAAPPTQRAEAAPAPSPRRSDPAPQSEPAARTEPVIDDSPYDTASGGDYQVQRRETLWGIAARTKPDGRLTMNQTMLAIFEANPDAFGGNINLLKAGASLRIPSADEVFRISRGEALSEVQRQHQAWGSGTVPMVDDSATRPSLVLVPPDEELVEDGSGTDSLYGEEPLLSREEEIAQRIDELLVQDVTQDRSLIEIRDNELAALRQELADIRGEPYEPPVEDPFVEDLDEDMIGDDVFVDDEIMADDDLDESVIEDGVDIDDADEEAAQPVAQPRPRSEPSLVDRAIEALTSIWAIIAGAVVVAGGVLFWFMRRGGSDEDDGELQDWHALDADDAGGETLSATESLRAPTPSDESIMVVEQESSMVSLDETIDSPAADFDIGGGTEVIPAEDTDKEPTGEFGSLEDTFSSETAVNLDQSDPVAEADFHMAYGLYDQAADLINGALAIEPERQDLLTKLCEIYFVWGNRDAFVDAAGRLKAATGGGDSADWDKIVIMGQQIAGDNEMFAGAGVAGATKAVDLSFEAGMDETGALDMELISDAGGDSDIVDLGGSDDAVDFDFGDDSAATGEVSSVDLDVTGESKALEEADFDLTAEMQSADSTVEMPAAESTVETPTIEQQFEGLDGTAELPSIDDSSIGEGLASGAQSADATAEINLDELGLDLDGLDETEVASLDDLDDFDAALDADTLSETGINEALDDLSDVTGKNPEIDPNATGVQTTLSVDDTGFAEALDIGEALAATSEVEQIDSAATGLNEMPDLDADSTDVDIDDRLLDATGVTQVLSGDMAVETTGDVAADLGDDDATMLAPGYGDDNVLGELGDDQETLLASLDDDDDGGDYDFAKTEALPADVFTGDASLDETGELPAVASTDVDLDLDDLTAALQVSEVGDTIEQLRDDATVEQPRPSLGASDDEQASTVALGPDDISDDLHEARTMTEVGTKLDLARAYVDMGDPAGARSILEEVLDEGDEGQRQQAQQLLDSLPS